MENSPRNDSVVQQAARNLFDGVAPERSEELERFWLDYQPRFNLLSDFGSAGSFVMEAGLYREVRFNSRAMRVFWLAGFIAWEGYIALHKLVTLEVREFDRFDQMVETFRQILKQQDPLSVPFPEGVPEPGVLPDVGSSPQLRATAELSIIATGWAFLHEVRHLQHQQNSTGARENASSQEKHDEELSCDKFATDFIMENVADYAAQSEFDAQKVRQKRELGVYFAMFAMTLICEGHWNATDSHPDLQSRIDATIKNMGATGTQISDSIAHSAFVALWRIWPDAPGPFRK